jgi:hypothetical protein
LRPDFFKNRNGHLAACQVAPAREYEMKQHKNQQVK